MDNRRNDKTADPERDMIGCFLLYLVTTICLLSAMLLFTHKL